VTRPLALVLLAALAGCNTGFEPQYRVTDLRILGVRSEVQGSTFADPTADDTLVLEALVANPRGAAPLEARWYACAPAASDAVPACVDDAVLSDPDRLASTPGVLALPGGEVVADVPPAVRVRVTIALPAVAPAPVVQAGFERVAALALEQPTFRCRAFLEIPVVVIVRAGGRREVALKRVRVAPRAGDLPGDLHYAPNRNPAVTDVTVNGCQGPSVVANPFPAERTTLCARSGPGSAETFDVCDAAGSASSSREDLDRQWYVTAGEFPDEGGVGNATDASPDFDRPPGAFTLWAILRDGRGGEDWFAQRIAPLAASP
jgi:hypothetical protein